MSIKNPERTVDSLVIDPDQQRKLDSDKRKIINYMSKDEGRYYFTRYEPLKYSDEFGKSMSINVFTEDEMPQVSKSHLIGHMLTPQKTYEEVLSNPQLVTTS